MVRVVVDTSVVIDYLRRKDKENCLFARLRGVVDMVISFITVTELYSGKSSRNPKGMKLIEEIIASCETKLVGLEDAAKVGEIRRDYQLSLGDCFVAQLAMNEKLPLATLDKKAFAKIIGIKLWETP
jgi:hypothetical protein